MDTTTETMNTVDESLYNQEYEVEVGRTIARDEASGIHQEMWRGMVFRPDDPEPITHLAESLPAAVLGAIEEAQEAP